MSEHLTRHQIEDYARRKLSTADLLSLSDHLVACEPCRREIEKALGADATFFALRSEIFGDEAEIVLSATDTHPALDHITEYVDGALAGDELRIMKDHLAVCEQCSMAVDDLGAFRDQVAPQLDREYHPVTRRTKPEGWWRHPFGLLPATFQKSPALAFGSAVVLLLLLTIVWLVWHGEKKEHQPELVLATRSPTSLPATPTVTPAASPTVGPEEAAAPLVAELNDGDGRVTLNRAGKLSGIEHLSPAYQQMVQEALVNQRLEKSSLLAGLNRPASSLMSGSARRDEFSVIEPVGKVLQSNRPTFGWSQLSGATAYVVEVYDEAFNLVATSPRLAGTFWTSQPLKRGRIYSWQVKAIKDGQEIISPRPPAAQAKFRILDSERADELRLARLNYASSHLMLGLLDARAGLLDEAEKEFRALQKANPDSALARRLLSEVRKLRR